MEERDGDEMAEEGGFGLDRRQGEIPLPSNTFQLLLGGPRHSEAVGRPAGAGSTIGRSQSGGLEGLHRDLA